MVGVSSFDVDVEADFHRAGDALEVGGVDGALRCCCRDVVAAEGGHHVIGAPCGTVVTRHHNLVFHALGFALAVAVHDVVADGVRLGTVAQVDGGADEPVVGRHFIGGINHRTTPVVVSPCAFVLQRAAGLCQHAVHRGPAGSIAFCEGVLKRDGQTGGEEVALCPVALLVTLLCAHLSLVVRQACESGKHDGRLSAHSHRLAPFALVALLVTHLPVGLGRVVVALPCQGDVATGNHGGLQVGRIVHGLDLLHGEVEELCAHGAENLEVDAQAHRLASKLVELDAIVQAVGGACKHRGVVVVHRVEGGEVLAVLAGLDEHHVVFIPCVWVRHSPASRVDHVQVEEDAVGALTQSHPRRVGEHLGTVVGVHRRGVALDELVAFGVFLDIEGARVVPTRQ